METKEKTFSDQISRLMKVQKAINEFLLKKGPPAVAPRTTEAEDPIEKCLKEAEKLVREGKIFSAIEKQNQCEKLIAEHD